MDKVTISNLQGESGLANVVRYFINNGTEYLIYSLNEVDEAGYTRLYVTKMNGVDGNYTAESLNDTEWSEIKNLVKVIVKANKENLPLPIQDINPKKIRNIVLKDKKIFKLNTPLVNDLSANKPTFNDNDEAGTGEQKTAFNMPIQPTFETPAAPTFDMPVQPTFETPAAPAFNMPAQPTFETPAASAFNMPAQPTFETPAAPTFDMPAQPTFETPAASAFNMPAQPTFETPAASTFDMPAQPTFETPAAPTFETPAAPTFDMTAQPTFETPAAPTFETQTSNNITNNTFDFANMNAFDNTLQSSNINQETSSVATEKNVSELQDEIKRLQDELAKYKSIIENVKDIVEK